MIELIGYMTAAFIITKMMQLILDNDIKKVVKVLATITVLISITSIIGLAGAGNAIRSAFLGDNFGTDTSAGDEAISRQRDLLNQQEKNNR